ncbi:MAG: hypothetical protein LBF15_04130 [Candidatus Peribacteria bacterium]|jgi:hypothetical protein|nr:hypothetical protein [Candidatus Peribacteria bacterium]
MFGFWDTFVTTFLIDYIDTILASSRQELAKFGIQNLFTAYVAIALFSAPAYG